MANVIFRGDTRYPPKTRTRTIKFAGVPGQPVTEVNNEFVVAPDNHLNPLILNNLDFIGQPLNKPYSIDDSAVAFELREIRMPFQVRAAAGTYSNGDKLVISGGVYTVGTSGDMCSMIYSGPNATILANALIDAETILPTEVV